jgi:hypothetical protein
VCVSRVTGEKCALKTFQKRVDMTYGPGVRRAAERAVERAERMAKARQSHGVGTGGPGGKPGNVEDNITY